VNIYYLVARDTLDELVWCKLQVFVQRRTTMFLTPSFSNTLLVGRTEEAGGGRTSDGRTARRDEGVPTRGQGMSRGPVQDMAHLPPLLADAFGVCAMPRLIGSVICSQGTPEECAADSFMCEIMESVKRFRALIVLP